MNQQKPDVTEVVLQPPDHAGCFSIRLGEQAAPLAGPQDCLINPSFCGLGGPGGQVQCRAPPAPKPAVTEGVQLAPNHASWLFTRCGKQAAP